MRHASAALLVTIALASTACDRRKTPTRDTSSDDDDDDRSSRRSRRHDEGDEGRPSRSFKLASSIVKTNGTIGVTFDAPLRAPEGQQYWITLVDASQPDSTYGAWHYLKNGVTEDQLAAGAPGEYEVRFYDLHPRTKDKVLTRQHVSVVECVAASDCPGAGPLCDRGRCVGAGSSPVPITPAGPNDFLADGWPAVIPPPGSSAPSTAEWAAVPREVTVKGSSGLKCETKVVREWLRVSCHANSLGVPVTVTHRPAFGQQAFTFVAEGSVASVVVQMIPGKTYTADFSWTGPDTGTSTYTLTATWINGRPNAAFNVPGGL